MLDLRNRLDATDRQLDVRIKILNAETDAIDTDLGECLCKFAGDGSGAEFNGVFATWQDLEAGADNFGDFLETLPRQ